jgi:transcriptional regulator with XRE-family HTH domain
MMNYLAKNLKYLRRRFNVSQQLLARQVGKGQTTIGNWENRVSRPNVEEISTIARYFGVAVDSLLNTDMGASQPVTDKQIALFRRHTPPPVRKISNYEPITSESMVSEDESSLLRDVLQTLKNIDVKLEKLLGES